jgi:hypothetical protein
MPESSVSIVPSERIYRSILFIRDHKVVLDQDLAALYGTETKKLLQAVKRNIDRFPEDFMFQLNNGEFNNLRSQFVTSSWGGRRYPPYAFTEQGVAMLSSVLRSKRAIAANIAIMRTFVKLREILVTNEALRRKIESMERKYEEQFKLIFNVLSKMVIADSKPKSQIGFFTEAKGHVPPKKTKDSKIRLRENL